ncbi:uracil-DNA glycosylase [Sulfitobacter sp. BDSS02]|nr:uracil-DNA glycosylase [Sulfitobacter sp. BDSS02]MBR9847817.1 uracil-DNA glycosylase [Paracoccaceae bacterium]
MESYQEFEAARAMLEWQIELGATEAICDAPIDRYSLPDALPKPAQASGVSQAVAQVEEVEVDAVAEARAAAKAAASLDALHAALAAFEHCDIKKGARSLVFGDGTPGARVMIIGDAPDRDEDRAGRPFVGKPGELLDAMLAAIGLSRAENVYVTTALPWRLPQNHEPRPDQLAMLRPFLERHVSLAAPEFLIVMGNTACDAVLERRGISRLRGHWAEIWGRPVLPMLHPAQLLGRPRDKKMAWADLLELNARLKRSTS